MNNVTKTLSFPIPSIKILDPKITDMKNALVRFYKLNTDVTKNLRKYFFTHIDDFIIFLLTQTVIFSVSAMYARTWTTSA